MTACTLLRVVTLTICLPASAATYYVSASLGDDSRDGLSEQTCWQTISRVNRAELRPGDRVLLRRGDLWRETLRPRFSGREHAPIVLSAYGQGAAPVLSGGSVNIDNNGQSYIVYENLDLREAQEGLRIYVQDSRVTGITFQNNRIETRAKRPGGVVSAGLYAHAVRGRVEGLFVLNNTFIPYPKGLEHWGVYLVAGIRRFQIRNNRFAPAGEDAITVWHSSGGLIEGNTGGRNGENTIDVKDSARIAIRRNRGEGDREYCIVAHSVDGVAEGIRIEGNRCTNSGQGRVLSSGIALLRARACQVRHNRIENPYGAAILVRDGQENTENQIAHNVVAGAGHGISPIVLQEAPGAHVFDNRIIPLSPPPPAGPSQSSKAF
jgi:hypothetical protein